MAHPILEARAITLSYGVHTVVAGFDLAIHAGQIVALVGENGAGKSTLLRGLMGMLPPSSGEVVLAGEAIVRMSRGQLARRMSLVPQDYALDLPFTAADVVLMGRYPHTRGLPTQADAQAAAQALARCDVYPLHARRYATLSGGERRRVLVAQALCQRADVMLLDEPTASLDPAHQLVVFDELRKEAHDRGAAVVVATHELNLPARFCDRLIVLANGRITADGAPEEVLSSAALASALGVSLHVGRLPGGGPLFVVPH